MNFVILNSLLNAVFSRQQNNSMLKPFVNNCGNYIFCVRFVKEIPFNVIFVM